MKQLKSASALVLAVCLLFSGCASPAVTAETSPGAETTVPAVLTEEALAGDLTEAALFYKDWFYDRSAVIDPAYSDFGTYPPVNLDGTRPVYPTAAEGISTCSDLLEKTQRYFSAEAAEAMLETIGAVDQDGQLCVTKSDGLGGVGLEATITVDLLVSGKYALTIDYRPVQSEYVLSSATIWYSPGAQEELFGGTETSLGLFFVAFLYAEQITYVLS